MSVFRLEAFMFGCGLPVRKTLQVIVYAISPVGAAAAAIVAFFLLRSID